MRAVSNNDDASYDDWILYVQSSNLNALMKCQSFCNKLFQSEWMDTPGACGGARGENENDVFVRNLSSDEYVR